MKFSKNPWEKIRKPFSLNPKKKYLSLHSICASPTVRDPLYMPHGWNRLKRMHKAPHVTYSIAGHVLIVMAESQIIAICCGDAIVTPCSK